MGVITEPLAVAALAFALGAAAFRLFQYAGFETDEVEAKMVFRLLLLPFCFAVLILVVDGIANHLYLVRWLQL